MLRIEAKQLNFYSELYHRIPKSHILKRINEAMSFSFINELLEGSYSKDFGRPAKEPEMMVKLLLLQKLYNLSDERVIEETEVNLAYMYFIGINPDEALPHPSLLAKFRTMRLKEVTIDDMLTETVRQSIEKGLIKAENGISEDTTHVLANTTKKVPERVMKHLAKKIFKAMGIEEYEIPDYKQVSDHKEAKHLMKGYLENVIEASDARAEKEARRAKEIIESPLFIEQRGIRSIVDTDARVGYKSKKESFFGYKMEYCLTTEGRLITAVGVHGGSYVDGADFKDQYERSKKSGLKIKNFYGDKAYFKKHIFEVLKEDNVNAYIPVNACSYQINEDLYAYNKDSDQWICVQGNKTVRKRLGTTKRKGRAEEKYYEYTFEKNKCIDCCRRSECIKSAKTKGKKLQISLNTNEYYEHSQWSKTQEFKTEYRKRSAIEWKNAEMKRFHGLSRAHGYGLTSVSIQAKLTALAVNLKRIVNLLSFSNHIIITHFAILRIFSRFVDMRRAVLLINS